MAIHWCGVHVKTTVNEKGQYEEILGLPSEITPKRSLPIAQV